MRFSRLITAFAAASLVAACTLTSNISDYSKEYGVTCGEEKKLCKAGCIKVDDPLTGCGEKGCDPCAAFTNATTACGATAPFLCVPTCDVGFENCNGESADGCEVNLNESSENCGQCGNSCKGTRCQGGKCVATVLAENQPNPGEIAIDGDFVYWSSFGTPTTPGQIARVGKDGKNFKVIADNQLSAWGVTVESGDAYWSTYATPHFIARTVKDGTSASTPLSNGAGRMRAVAADGTFVFACNYDSDQMWRVPRAGGSFDAFTAKKPNDITVDTTDIYWTNEYTVANMPTGTLVKMAKNAPLSTTATVLASNLNRPRGVVVDSKFVYWTNAGNSNPSSVDGSIMRIAKDGTASTPDTLVTGLGNPRELAIDDTHIYFTVYLSGSIQRVRKDAAPGTQAELVATNQSNPLGIAVDADSIFWVNYGQASLSNGVIFRMLKP